MRSISELIFALRYLNVTLTKCGGSMMTDLSLADFAAIALNICPSNPTRCYDMDGKEDIHDAGHVMQKIQSCSINSKNTTLIQETANVSIALKYARNHCTLTTVMTQMTLEDGHANHVTCFDADHGVNVITRINKMPTTTPGIKTAKIKECSCKQSKYKIAPECPFRAIAYGPSGSGKSVLLQQFILDVYRGCFERIYIWSPSIDIDHVWDLDKKYMKKELLVDTKKEKCFYPTYNPKELVEVMDRQFKIAEWMKNDGKSVFNIMVIIADFADEPCFTRQSKLFISCTPEADMHLSARSRRSTMQQHLHH